MDTKTQPGDKRMTITIPRIAYDRASAEAFERSTPEVRVSIASVLGEYMTRGSRKVQPKRHTPKPEETQS